MQRFCVKYLTRKKLNFQEIEIGINVKNLKLKDNTRQKGTKKSKKSKYQKQILLNS